VFEFARIFSAARPPRELIRSSALVPASPMTAPRCTCSLHVVQKRKPNQRGSERCAARSPKRALAGDVDGAWNRVVGNLEKKLSVIGCACSTI
jgi:hypothetical protein